MNPLFEIIKCKECQKDTQYIKFIESIYENNCEDFLVYLPTIVLLTDHPFCHRINKLTYIVSSYTNNIMILDSVINMILSELINNDIQYMIRSMQEISCAYNPSLQIVQYLIKKNTYLDNIHNLIEVACMSNQNLEIVRFLVNLLGQNKPDNPMDKYIILELCKKIGNLNKIKYLIEECSMDPNIVNSDYDNALTLACWKNPNLHVIRYLVDLGMDLYQQDIGNNNCLHIACWGNENLKVIQYLIEEKHMDINLLNGTGKNALYIACQYNSNLEIIKYLIEGCSMNPGFISKNINPTNCVTIGCNCNENDLIIKYLIESTDGPISVYNCNDYNRFEIIAKNIFNYKRLNDYMKICFDLFYKDNNNNKDTNIIAILGYNDIVKNLNPLTLEPHLRYDLKSEKIKDLYKESWKYFIECVDQLKFIVPFSFDHDVTEKYIEIDRIDSINDKNVEEEKVYSVEDNKDDGTDDCNKTSESDDILFSHNKILYRGSRKIIYPIIDLFEDIDMYDLDEPMVLSAPLPEYIMKMYIQSSIDLNFDFDKVLPLDLIKFLNFIDQYPTKVLSLSLKVIQKNLVKYLIKHRINICPTLMDLCDKYKLKDLYLLNHLKKKNLFHN